VQYTWNQTQEKVRNTTTVVYLFISVVSKVLFDVLDGIFNERSLKNQKKTLRKKF